MSYADQADPPWTCRHCNGSRKDDTPWGTQYCSLECFYCDEGGFWQKAGAPVETEAPRKGMHNKLPSDALGESFSQVAELCRALTGDGPALGEPFMTALPKLESALIKGLSSHVRLLALRDAFKDYAAGKMSPGELINKLSAQVQRV